MSRTTKKYQGVISYTTKRLLKNVVPKKVKKTVTEGQRAQRLRFGMAMSFLSRIKSLIKLGFKPTKSLSEMNLAMRHFLSYCIVGDYPDYTIAYEKLKISHGHHEIGYGRHFIIFPMIGGKIDLSWEESIYRERQSNNSDQLNVLFYNETKNEVVVLEKITTRSAYSYTAALDPSNAGHTIYSWIFFSAENGRICSETRYLGPVVLLA